MPAEVARRFLNRAARTTPSTKAQVPKPRRRRKKLSRLLNSSAVRASRRSIPSSNLFRRACRFAPASARKASTDRRKNVGFRLSSRFLWRASRQPTAIGAKYFLRCRRLPAAIFVCRIFLPRRFCRESPPCLELPCEDSPSFADENRRPKNRRRVGERCRVRRAFVGGLSVECPVLNQSMARLSAPFV